MSDKALSQEPMRDATPEEQKSVNDYIKSISIPTGVKFGDAISREYLKKIAQSEGAYGYVSSYDIATAPSVNPQPCDDAISREAVNTLVDELARAISDERCCIPQRGRSTEHIMHDILELPSVNPQPCDDAIIRQAVINAIENDCMRGGLGSCFACYNDAQAFRGEIEKLTPVNPHKSGKWLRVTTVNPKEFCNRCSECEYEQFYAERYNFCPNCGADMRGAE